MEQDEKPLSQRISDLGVHIVPLQSHDYSIQKWYLLTDATNGQILEDDRTAGVVSLLEHHNIDCVERDSRITVKEPSAIAVLQEITDSHEYRYHEHFHSGQILSVSNIMDQSETEKHNLYESIALSGKWRLSNTGSLVMELRLATKPIGELIHLLNGVDAHFSCEHVNHSDLLHVTDAPTISAVQQARTSIIKRIGYDHPEIKDMQNRIRDLIMFAQSVQVGAEIKPEPTPNDNKSP